MLVPPFPLLTLLKWYNPTIETKHRKNGVLTDSKKCVNDFTVKKTMFGLLTSCISMVLLLSHYGAKGYYLRRIESTMVHPVS